jgi:hypothetical protein
MASVYTDCDFKAGESHKYRFYNVGQNRIMEMAIWFREMPDKSFQIAKSGYGYEMLVTINKSNDNAELSPPNTDAIQKFSVSFQNTTVCRKVFFFYC